MEDVEKPRLQRGGISEIQEGRRIQSGDGLSRHGRGDSGQKVVRIRNRGIERIVDEVGPIGGMDGSTEGQGPCRRHGAFDPDQDLLSVRPGRGGPEDQDEVAGDRQVGRWRGRVRSDGGRKPWQRPGDGHPPGEAPQIEKQSLGDGSARPRQRRVLQERIPPPGVLVPQLDDSFRTHWIAPPKRSRFLPVRALPGSAASRPHRRREMGSPPPGEPLRHRVRERPR